MFPWSEFGLHHVNIMPLTALSVFCLSGLFSDNDIEGRHLAELDTQDLTNMGIR